MYFEHAEASPSDSHVYIQVQNTVATPVPGIGVPGWGIKLVQPPGSLLAPPCSGHNFYTGGG